MNLAIHNFLMRLSSPLAHVIFLGLAIMFMSLTSHAQTSTSPIQLIVIDNPGCPACMKFNAEIGQAGFDESPEAERATMSFVVAGSRPPQWLIDASQDGRLKKIQYTPTFLFMTVTSDGTSREVGRFVGYRDKEWFFGKVREMLDLIEPHVQDRIFQEGDGETLYFDRSMSEVNEFDRKRSV